MLFLNNKVENRSLNICVNTYMNENTQLLSDLATLLKVNKAIQTL